MEHILWILLHLKWFLYFIHFLLVLHQTTLRFWCRCAFYGYIYNIIPFKILPQKQKPSEFLHNIHAQTALFREIKSTDYHRCRGDFFLSAPRTRGENRALSHTRQQVFIKTILPPRVSHRPWLPGSPLKWTVLSDLFFPRTCSRRGMFLSIPVFARPSSSISSSSGLSSHTRWRVEALKRYKYNLCAHFFWFDIISNEVIQIAESQILCHTLAVSIYRHCSLRIRITSLLSQCVVLALHIIKASSISCTIIK